MIEREYNIPLRKEGFKVATYKRTQKAVKTVRNFLMRHMKVEVVKLGRYLNMELHKNGMKNPPHHIKVKAIKDKMKVKDKEIDVCKAELVGAPEEKATKVEEVKEAVKVKVEDKKEQKLEEKVEKQEEEKKDVLEHAKHEERHEKTVKEFEGQRAGKMEKVMSTKRDFRKDQKPSH